jgi:hypothetical protein
MRQAYHRMITELQKRGYIVAAAEGDIPTDSSSLAFVDAALECAEASIHLLGSGAGYCPEGAEPIVKLQLSRAAFRASAAVKDGTSSIDRFRRIIWAPRGGPPERDPFRVLAGFDRQLETDKVESGTLSQFVDFLLQHLDRTAPIPEIPGGIGAGTRVYVYHRPEDTDYAIELAKALQQREIDPVLPAQEGDFAARHALHRQYLLHCDAVILCWANAEEVWAKATSFELMSWRDLGRTQKFACRGLVTGPPPNEHKARFKTIRSPNEIDVVLDLTAFEKPPPEALDPLIHPT